jgi:hypothetical protein
VNLSKVGYVEAILENLKESSAANPQLADKLDVKLRESRVKQAAAGHSCERRESKRLLCSDLVQLLWLDPDGQRRREVVILENLSLAGVGLFTGVAVPQGTEVQILANDLRLAGQIKHCIFRENGYVVGLELDANSKWAQEPGSTFLPEHLLDVSSLDLD